MARNPSGLTCRHQLSGHQPAVLSVLPHRVRRVRATHRSLPILLRGKGTRIRDGPNLRHPLDLEATAAARSRRPISRLEIRSYVDYNQLGIIDRVLQPRSIIGRDFVVTPDMTTSYAHQRIPLFFANCRNTLTAAAGARGCPELVSLQHVTSRPVSHRLP